MDRRTALKTMAAAVPVLGWVVPGVVPDGFQLTDHRRLGGRDCDVFTRLRYDPCVLILNKVDFEPYRSCQPVQVKDTFVRFADGSTKDLPMTIVPGQVVTCVAIERPTQYETIVT